MDMVCIFSAHPFVQGFNNLIKISKNAKITKFLTPLYLFNPISRIMKKAPISQKTPSNHTNRKENKTD